MQPHPFANLAQVPLFPAPSATHPGAALGRLGVRVTNQPTWCWVRYSSAVRELPRCQCAWHPGRHRDQCRPAIRPQDALTHETVDHFIPLLVMYMSVGVAPLMWKRDVAQAFRKVPIKHDATDLSWVVFPHAGVLWASQHLSMPFGSTSANYARQRIGSLLKVIIVKVFLAPTCRYVDDFFGCDPEGCMVTGGAPLA